MHQQRSRALGFSLGELLMTLAILGILTAIALPSYRYYLLKSRRSEAIATILQIQASEEIYRLKNSTYGSLSQVWNNVTATPNGYYTLVISNTSATGYTITATASGMQASDTACANIVLTMNSGTTTKTPAACWGG